MLLPSNVAAREAIKRTRIREEIYYHRDVFYLYLWLADCSTLRFNMLKCMAEKNSNGN